jgi:hypothetical protein
MEELALGSQFSQRPITKMAAQRRSSSDRSSYDTRMEIGRRLYDAVFDNNVLRLFNQARDVASQTRSGLRIGIVTDKPIVQNLAWELLHDGGQFLCLASNTPVVRLARVSSADDEARMLPGLTVGIYAYSEQAVANPAVQGVIKLLRAHADQIAVLSNSSTAELASADILYMVDGFAPASEKRLTHLPYSTYYPKLVFQSSPDSVEGNIELPDISAPTAERFVYHFFENFLEYQPIEVAVTNARQYLNVSDPGSYSWAEPRLSLRSAGFRLVRPDSILPESYASGSDTAFESLRILDDPERQRLERRLAVFEQNRQSLAAQRALYGSDVKVPAQINVQIERLERQMANVRQQIAAITK